MTKQLRADIALLCVTLVWGSSFAFMKQAINYIPPFMFLACRYFIAALALCLIFYKSLKKIDKKVLKYGFIIGLTMFAGCAFQIVGLQFTTASKSGFITGLNVVLVPLFLAVRYKKAPPVTTILGILVAVIGLGLLTIDSSMVINIGDILTFLAAIAFALQVIYISRYSPGQDPIALTIIAILTVSVLSAIPGMIFEDIPVELNPPAVFSLIYTALFCSSFACSIQMTFQKDTSPTHAALIFMGEPVFSMIFAFIFLHERLTLRGIIGCALVFAGMLISEIKHGTVIDNNTASEI